MEIAIILDNAKTANRIIESYIEYPNVIFEFRIDLDKNLMQLIKDKPQIAKKSILTYRSEKVGGKALDSNRRDIIVDFISADPRYIDLELDSDLEFLDKVQNSGSVPIISKHDFSSSFTLSAEEYYEKVSSIKNFVGKFVGMPNDALEMLNVLDYLKSKIDRHVILGINESGLISRTMGEIFSQEFVFGSSNETAGIPNFKDILKSNHKDAIHLGLIGSKLSHSLSPKIQRFFLETNNRFGDYLKFKFNSIKRAEKFIKLISKKSFLGLNITFPYKNIIPKVSDIISPEVRISGVGNTLHFSKGEIRGYNTDITGFKKFIKNHVKNKISRVIIFGAGGAAISVGLALKEKEIAFVNRTVSRFESFPEALKDTTKYSIKKFDAKLNYDCYINATTIGYNGLNPTQKVALPRSVETVIDLNYLKGNTLLVSEALKKGIEAIDGKAMLFHQAADAFEIWTGIKIIREGAYQKYRRII